MMNIPILGLFSASPSFLRMRSDRTKGAAQVDESRAIQMQGRHGRTAGGSASLDVPEVCAPREVARPLLAARVEKRDGSSGLRIARVRLGVLVAVTAGHAQASSAAVLPTPSTRGRTCSQTK